MLKCLPFFGCIGIISMPCQVGSQRCPIPAIRYSGAECFSRYYVWKACLSQGVMITRSCAIRPYEPCQSLTAAALSRISGVPQGCFVGATYDNSTSVYGNEKRCTTLQIISLLAQNKKRVDYFNSLLFMFLCYFL